MKCCVCINCKQFQTQKKLNNALKYNGSNLKTNIIILQLIEFKLCDYNVCIQKKKPNRVCLLVVQKLTNA